MVAKKNFSGTRDQEYKHLTSFPSGKHSLKFEFRGQYYGSKIYIL